jgi:hypothetical protein
MTRALPNIRFLLQDGDRRTIGKVSAVLRAVLTNPQLTSSLVQCLFDTEPPVRMRAADALEKLSRERVAELQSYANQFVDLLERSTQPEVLWHFALLLPRLQLDAAGRRRTSEALQRFLHSESSILKTCALQGLADLALQEPTLIPVIVDLLESSESSGTPAMKARSRILLKTISTKRVV